jgi:hypothetical protein
LKEWQEITPTLIELVFRTDMVLVIISWAEQASVF